MSNLALFAIEVSVSLALSLSVILMLRSSLADLLTETCGTPRRAAFWMSFTQLMLVIAPLLPVVFFADARPGIPEHPAETIKDALFQSLLGVSIALAMIGRVIWKTIIAGPPAERGSERGRHQAEAR